MNIQNVELDKNHPLVIKWAEFLSERHHTTNLYYERYLDRSQHEMNMVKDFMIEIEGSGVVDV